MLHSLNRKRHTAAVQASSLPVRAASMTGQACKEPKKITQATKAIQLVRPLKRHITTAEMHDAIRTVINVTPMTVFRDMANFPFNKLQNQFCKAIAEFRRTIFAAAQDKAPKISPLATPMIGASMSTKKRGSMPPGICAICLALSGLLAR